MWSAIIIGMAFTALIAQSIVHRAERKELYNRIMAKDLNEYQSLTLFKEKDPNKQHVEKNLLKKRIDYSYRVQNGGEE